MSYSPARIDESSKPEIELPALPETNPEAATPIPSWFADGFGHEDNTTAAERYRERLARHAERQRSENEQMEEYRRKLDEKFVMAKQLYDRPGNDNPRDASWAEPRPSEPAVEPPATFPQSSQTRLPMGSSSAEPILRARRPTVPLAEIEKRKKRYAKEGKDIKQRRQQKRSSSNLLPSPSWWAEPRAMALPIAVTCLPLRRMVLTGPGSWFPRWQQNQPPLSPGSWPVRALPPSPSRSPAPGWR